MWLGEAFIGLQSSSGETGPAIAILIGIIFVGFFTVKWLVGKVGKFLGGIIQLIIGIGLMSVVLYIYFSYISSAFNKLTQGFSWDNNALLTSL